MAWLGKLIPVSLGLIFATIHSLHVSSLLENEKHFSHLSTVEREMSFRTEMGFYYSYYKRIVMAPDFITGYRRLLDDRLVEAPNVTNSLQRFNVYPEQTLLGLLYHSFRAVCGWAGVEARQCWRVGRDVADAREPVWSCVGLAEPIYFYLTGVWICAGLTALMLYVFGCQMSGNWAGGVLTVSCFFFNHGEATRVMWAPPLRENFAFPFLLAQMVHVCKVLHTGRARMSQMLGVGCMTAISILFWQFSEFLLLTQCLILALFWAFNLISRQHLNVIFGAILTGNLIAGLLMFGNRDVVGSGLTSLLLGVVYVVNIPLYDMFPCRDNVVWRVVCLLGSTVVVRDILQFFREADSNSHVWRLILAKFTSYRDWDTMLYTCAAEFDFLGWSAVSALNRTLLLPAAVAAALLTSAIWIGPLGATSIDAVRSRAAADLDVVYTVAQTAACAVMAGLFMRLKLFMTPMLCVCTALLASNRVSRLLRRPSVHWSCLIVLIALMAVQGTENIRQQYKIIGEFENPQLEEMLVWIKSSTLARDSFAGPMAVTPNVLLSTGRPIVNHPHYESKAARLRTYLVYEAFSRKPANDLYRALRYLQVDYLILHHPACFGTSSSGCAMVDLWDLVDKTNSHRPPLCPTLFHNTPPPFSLAFRNHEYAVLRVPTTFLQLPPPNSLKA